MARHEKLNNLDHAGLRVRTERDAGLGDAVMSAALFPHEFRRAQAHYPIVFQKEGATGRFRPVALFGLEAGENLFLNPDGQGWDAAYLPVAVRMAPFLIGRDRSGAMEVHVDLDHPRVSDAGEPVFLEHGGQAPLLQQAAETLGEVAEGDEVSAAFCARLAQMDLLEPFTLDVALDDGSQGRLAGLYVVAEERLAALGAEELNRLHRAGMLICVFMAVASLSRLEDLIARRNARLGTA